MVVVVTLIVVAEEAALRSSVEAAKRPRLGRDPIGVPAFVSPPPPEVIIGEKIRLG
jgi:hypothetical protein